MLRAVWCGTRTALVALVATGPVLAGAQSATAPRTASAQNPSPMTESTRAHERLNRTDLGGTTRTFAGPAGKTVEIHVPANLARRGPFDLVVHFHGEAWLPQQAVASLRRPRVSAVLHLGTGSGVYDRSFSDPAVFDSLLVGIAREVSSARGSASGADQRVGRITLVGFSAGHGAVRAILREPRHFATVDAVLLIDGMHTSYVPEGQVIASGGTLDTTNLVAFRQFATAALRGEKRFLITHSEIFPGTFASTTETADWLITSLGLTRARVLRWGPRGLQQLSEVKRRHFELRGYAGNSAPDHIDQLHAMPELLARLLK